MRYLAITTCNAEQWMRYGRAMVNTFRRYWPDEVPFRLYTEGFECEIAGVGQVELDVAAPWLAPWKAARSNAERGAIAPYGRPHKTYTFKTDAVRFSHKVAAIGAAAEDDEVDVLIWMDADIVTHSPVTEAWLIKLFPEPAAVAWLDRERVYPECGFMMFRLPPARGVIREIVAAYQNGEIFRLAETHDSFVIHRFVNRAVARGEISVASLSGEARACHHPFVAGPLGSRMDHLKGSRKKLGRSHDSDLLTPRSELYWQ